MPFLKLQKCNLFYRYQAVPGAETVLFVNSLGTSLEIWSAVADVMSGKFGLLFFDKRGHGLSSTPEGTTGIDDYADDAIALMDHLGLEKVNVVGLSIGGLISLSLASRYPDRIGRMVLSNTGAKLGTAESWNDRIAGIEQEGLDAHAENIVQRWLSPGFRRSNPEQTAGMVTMLQRNSALGYVRACEAIRDADYRPILSEIQHPVQFIGGSEDVGTTGDFILKQAKLMGAGAEIIPGVGHLPCMETPEIMARIIADFLSDPGEESLYDRGMRTRRAVLGDAHVDRAEANKTEFDADFQEYIVNSAWGSIWSRPGLTKRERSLITLSLLAALGHDQELAMHIRACENTGASAEDIKEALLHTGIYAGVPVTNHAMKIAKEILAQQKKNDG